MSTRNLGLDHIHLFVKDLEEAVAFYKGIGLEFLAYTQHGANSCMMQAPGTSILFEIQEVGTIDVPGVNHLAFLVDDLDGICADLRARGCRLEGPVKVKATERYLATLRDPHGFLVQLVQK